MSSPQSRPRIRRILAPGLCAAALLLGPAAGLAAADDASLVKTVTERAQQLGKRETALGKTLKALQRSPTHARAVSAQKDADAIYRTTVALRDEVRDDDGSTDAGSAARDALLPKLTSVAAAAKTLDGRLTTAARARRPTKAQVAKVVSAKLVLDKAIVSAVQAIDDAVTDDGPRDPAPAPTDPTV